MSQKSFITFALCIAILMPLSALARRQQQEAFQHVVYTETPVRSFFAQPNDVNFVPESVFMMRTDSLNYDDNIQAARWAEANANPGARIGFAERPTIVCRDFGCTRMNDRVTRAFLFNSLTNMFMMNQHSRMHICEADPFTRACLQAGISFPVRAGVANAIIRVPKATIDQVQLSSGMSSAAVGMAFELLINGVPVRCASTITDIVVPVNSQATLVSREFTCSITTDGHTSVSMIFNIDYIDLDYGILGGYYSLGLQGPAMGGGTGYALFSVEHSNRGLRMNPAATRMPQDSEPVPVPEIVPNNGDSNGNGNGAVQTIRPGEFAVTPLIR
jgi:hypothetical protein